MWLILFALSAVAALAFSVAAILLQDRGGLLWLSGQSGGPATSDLLLFRRMRLLGLDPAAIARTEPLSFWELGTRCRTCKRKERCAYDLAGKSSDWRAYCPNSLLLDLLATRETAPLTVQTDC